MKIIPLLGVLSHFHSIIGPIFTKLYHALNAQMHYSIPSILHTTTWLSLILDMSNVTKVITIQTCHQLLPQGDGINILGYIPCLKSEILYKTLIKRLYVEKIYNIKYEVCLLKQKIIAKNIFWNWYIVTVVKGKSIPLQAWTGHECSRRLRHPDFKTIITWKW
jgi:hypothetical protein